MQVTIAVLLSRGNHFSNVSQFVIYHEVRILAKPLARILNFPSTHMWNPEISLPKQLSIHLNSLVS